MGLFDGQGMGGAMPRNLAEMGRGVGQSLSKGFLDPYMESKGYTSEENRILEVMKDVDINSVDSVSDAFNKIMVISPEAASEFRAQVLPLVTAKQNELALKPKETTKDRQTKEVGYSYKGVSDPTKTMLVELVNGRWQPIIDPSTNLPYAEDKFAGDSYTGTIPSGWESVEVNGVRTLRPIQGGPADIEAVQAKEAEIASNEALTQKAETVLSVAADMKLLIQAADKDFNSQLWGPIGQAQALIAGTRSADLDAAIETINARVGFDELQAMRDASPTGGALGQVSELELKQLNAALGSLNRKQSKEQFLRNLERVETQYQNILDKIAETGDGTYLPKKSGSNSGSI
jgi:hypothetical protein